ncbi:hypothetical protein [Mesotoga prima]|uniref:hypothetical protein n=1 Tax=Mesotoga prima TaxID=1184387 RepID=UPI002FD95299
MTLTEEQRPTAGFDLEKARDVEKAMSPMPWIVLEEAHGEMIIIRNPNHPMYIDGIVAWGRVAEANTPDAIGIAYMRENFSNLIDEIERLRASLIDLHAEYINTLEKNPECSAWDLDEQSIEDQRRLRKNAMKAISISEPPVYLLVEEQAARIQELEEALVENLATDIAYDDRLLWSRLDGQRQDEYREKARQQLQAEGKIGTGARPPCWQITEDRVTAIDQGLRFLEWSNAKTGHVETKKRIAILKTMLEEASDEHGFER